MSSKDLTYAEAISEAMVIALENFPESLLMGIGVTSSAGIFGTTLEANKRFGSARLIDTPAMENALAGIAAGASLVGLNPVVIHARNDFALLSMDQFVNVYSKWLHMFDGNAGSIGVTTRLIIGRGWGQGATHSQSIQSVLAHFPGLRVVMPAFASDAKGMLLAAIKCKDPVMILEHRNLYTLSENVQTGIVFSSLEGARVVVDGTDVTIVASSICVHESIRAAQELSQKGISAEVIDLRVVQPLDFQTVARSVQKTGKLIIVDTSWTNYGVSAEIGARISEMPKYPLNAPLVRIGQSPNPAPTSKVLEEEHHPNFETIFNAAIKLFDAEVNSRTEFTESSFQDFQGPY